MERAKEALARSASHPDPWWLDYFDDRRLDGFDATVALFAGRQVLSSGTAGKRAARHALDRVERALGQLRTTTTNPAEYTPQDCVTVLDRANAYALINDDEQALALVERACQAVARRPYAAARDRLGTLHETLPASRVGQLREIEQAYLAA
ncbi:MAG: hypothetical protein ACYDH5_20500 [Acidimicrobiales bacterium]